MTFTTTRQNRLWQQQDNTDFDNNKTKQTLTTTRQNRQSKCWQRLLSLRQDMRGMSLKQQLNKDLKTIHRKILWNTQKYFQLPGLNFSTAWHTTVALCDCVSFCVDDWLSIMIGPFFSSDPPITWIVLIGDRERGKSCWPLFLHEPILYVMSVRLHPHPFIIQMIQGAFLTSPPPC